MSSNPQQATANFQTYVFGATHIDRDRLTIQYKTLQPSFQEIIERVLSAEYGLGNRLQKASNPNNGNGDNLKSAPVRILDAGCGEGLFLYYLAGLLEQQGLLNPAAVQLLGVDSDLTAIATAIDYVRTVQPARPYLRFICHDLTKSFEQHAELRAILPHRQEQPTATNVDGEEGGFDFIYAHLVAEHLPNAQQHVTHWYNLLKPGGILFLRDAVLDMGPNGTEVPHPALAPFFSRFMQYIKQINGFNVSEVTKDWLEELGAEQVQAIPLVLPAGGTSEIGLMSLRNIVMMVRNTLPQLIAGKMITEEQGQALLDTLYRELSPECVGHGTFIDTLACKPLA